MMEDVLKSTGSSNSYGIIDTDTDTGNYDSTRTLPTNTSSSSSILHSKNILSERVARALAVRTDTVAMKTAFDALQAQQLQQQHVGSHKSNQALQWGILTTAAGIGTGGSSSTLDSRSVRTAMEYDALQQALSVQESIKSMLSLVSQLRQDCDQIVETTKLIRATMHKSVLAPSVSVSETLTTASTTSPAAPTGITYDDIEEERKLTSMIADTLHQRDTIQSRVQTLQLFVQQHHLSDDDIYILEHFDFHDNSNSRFHNQSQQIQGDGMAFLCALKRVRKVRQALHQKFGSGSSSNELTKLAFLDGSTSSATSASTTTTAFKLMEQLSSQQENAYERLYHWLQQYLQFYPTSNTSSDDGNSMGSSAVVDDILLQNEFVLHAVQALKYIPPFYNHCIELIASQRRTIVTRKFLIALTVGTSSNNHDGADEPHQPPIEMKSHDSVAYVGDMLTYAFKMYSLEADLTKSLFLYQSTSLSSTNDDDDANIGEDMSSRSELDESTNKGSNLEGKDDDYDDAGTEEKALSAVDMLSISMSGIVRPLKSRILQVVAALCRRNDNSTVDSEDDEFDTFGSRYNSDQDDGTQIRTRAEQLYEICGLLLFYYSSILRNMKKLHPTTIMSKNSSTNEINMVAADWTSAQHLAASNELNPLLQCILECFIEATQGYETTIRVYCAMLDQIAILTGESIATLMQRLIVILIQIRTSSPGYLPDITQDCPDRTCQESLSMEWATKLLITSCFNVSTITIDDIVTIKESFQITKRNSNVQFDTACATKLEDMIMQKEMELLNNLIRDETITVFDMCGLSAIVNGWNHWKDNTVTNESRSSSIMSTQPGLTPNDIEMGIKDFYASLYSPPIPSFEMIINDPITRKMVRSNIAHAVISFYNELYNAIQTDTSYNDTTRKLLQHTPNEVQALFTV